ncbi:MAG TPA: M13 family metallopeptidase, partial [Candidatus Limnocylindrales bacterium]|nr:M13 family metallopeptidase [Candidatus Limnocylindrales bacterium]
HIDWTGVLAAIGAPRAKRINVVNINALTKIDAILAATPDDALRVYFDYKYADSLGPGLSSGIPGLPEDLADESAKIICDITLGMGAPGLVMERFVEMAVDPKSERLAKAMTRSIFRAFEKRLAANDFLDAATRIEAIGKIRGMRVTPLRGSVDSFEGVAFSPDSYLKNWEAMMMHRRSSSFTRIDKAVDRTALEGGLDANAFYAPDQNRIELQPGILHGVFFGLAAPRVLNFGALGWVIGHEITHGFDNSGRLFDARGTRRDWWSLGVAQSFDEKSMCFIEQYSAFEVPEAIDPETQLPRHIDGDLTLGENIADNGGLRVAYDAAEPYFKSGEPTAGFSPEQQFFIAGAQTWCGNMGAGFAEKVLGDVHAPNKARVNVTMSNFDRFASAFQCAPSDKMVAKNACKIW